MTTNETDKMKNIARRILSREIDAIEGIWELERIKKNHNDELASMIAFITADTDEIILSPNKYFYSPEFLEKQEKWKENYVKDLWPTITEICEIILK